MTDNELTHILKYLISQPKETECLSSNKTFTLLKK